MHMLQKKNVLDHLKCFLFFKESWKERFQQY